ncbi:MAG TPA: AAA family ATPase [Gaiellaceae bacterium]|nr:AAA family ATPase [Gaiellaceae bacterium]
MVLLCAVGGLVLAGSSAAAPPKNVSVPAIFGQAQVGQAVASTGGTWTASVNLSYQWRRCNAAGLSCTNIPGASGLSYSPVSADRGHTLRLVVTAKNAAGSVAVTSATTTIVRGGSGFSIEHWVSDAARSWLPAMFFLLMCVVVWLLWRTMGLMPRVKPMEITPGSASAVTWMDVAGLDEAKNELQEIVDFLRDPVRFEQLGARVPKGILFHGPPGTGKTLAAKAIANESGARFYAQSASAFVEMFAGLGAARIRKLFEEARKNAPSIIFIDELDAVGMARSGHSFNREQDQTLNQLLVELDGFGPRDQVVVMGASNRLQDLDPALLRPGRFDRQVYIQAPDLKGRRAILDVHTRGKPLAAGVDLDAVARQTSGLTGADLANIANEAAIQAGRRGGSKLEAADFEYALERVVAGLQQRRVVTDKEKRILAYHEGGHALVSHLVGREPQKATIIARGTALGFVLHLPDEERYLETKEELADWLVVALAGRAAEEIVFGRVTNGAANDLEKVTQIARSMVFEWGMGESVTSRTLRADNYALSEETKRLRDTEQAQLTDHAYTEALRMLQKHRPALDKVANALLERETLTRDELKAVFVGVEGESRSADAVGVIRVLGADPTS